MKLKKICICCEWMPSSSHLFIRGSSNIVLPWTILKE
jgi:hypothetical protein